MGEGNVIFFGGTKTIRNFFNPPTQTSNPLTLNRMCLQSSVIFQINNSLLFIWSVNSSEKI
jgi:hypothetical protein